MNSLFFGHIGLDLRFVEEIFQTRERSLQSSAHLIASRTSIPPCRWRSMPCSVFDSAPIFRSETMMLWRTGERIEICGRPAVIGSQLDGASEK